MRLKISVFSFHFTFFINPSHIICHHLYTQSSINITNCLFSPLPYLTPQTINSHLPVSGGGGGRAQQGRPAAGGA